jgi:hypothetical protein
MDKQVVNPVSFRYLQGGRVVFATDRGMLVLRGEYVGNVGDVPCFSEVRVVDYYDRRRAVDHSPQDFRGPFTIEVTTPQGEVISRIAVATAADVAAHPAGKVAYA